MRSQYIHNGHTQLTLSYIQTKVARPKMISEDISLGEIYINLGLSEVS